MKMASRIFFFWLPVAVLLLTSCEAPKGPKAVKWPELVTFDELAYQAEGLARIKDRDGILNQRASILEAGRAVSAETMPDNVANRTNVEQLLGDLSSLVEGFEQNPLPDDQLFALAEGFHPVVASLIVAAGMPHIHANEGPNEGHLYPVFGTDGGTQAGTAEIKLHDDAGDIEVWLTRGGRGGEVWDLPVASTLKIKFPGLNKAVNLTVRDASENRDESGDITVREGATNYFVFPGETGIDASWLMGEDFIAKAILEFEGSTTGEILLRPHAHHEDEQDNHGHGHDEEDHHH